MTSYAGTTYRHNCNRSGCFLSQYAVPFDLLADAFANKIRPMDGDGQVERNGYFLDFEWKSGEAEINMGERILFRAKTQLRHPSSNKPAVTLVVCWHTVGFPYRITHLQVMTDGKLWEKSVATTTDLWKFCNLWYRSVEKAGKPLNDFLDSYAQRLAKFEGKLRKLPGGP